MRAQTVGLVKQAVGQKVRAYVLVNNRTDGECAADCAGVGGDAQ